MKPANWLKTTLISLFLTLSGCGELANEHLSQTSLIYCSEGSPETFNPQLVNSGTTIDALSNMMYNRLAQIDQGTGNVVPELASHWEISEDGLEYRFHLREGVQFHTTDYFTPTRPLNADDVIFSFNRFLDKKHPFHFVGGATYHFFRSAELDKTINRIYKEDDHTVVFALNMSDSSFLSNIATDFAVILSAEYGENLQLSNNKKQLDTLPIGTGPYKFREFQRDVLIRYYKHPDYWRHDVQIDQLVFDITTNNSSRMAKLISHECDVIAYPIASQLSLLKQKQDIAIEQATVMNVGFWAFNTIKPPFDNVLVRRALAHAIDKNAILQAVFFGHATKARSILPPTSWAYDHNQNELEYNPHLAKKLLAEAGYPNGFSMDIWALPVQRVYNPNSMKTAELMQADLAKIGVTVNIVSYEWATFRRSLSNNEHDSVLIGWSADNADPDNFFRPLLSCTSAISGSNRASWCHTTFDDLLLKALLTQDHDTRKAYYQRAQAILTEQSPIVPLAHSVKFQAQLSDIKGVAVNPYGAISFETVYREKDR